MRFHEKDGSIMYMKIGWIFYLVAILPLNIAGIFTHGTVDTIRIVLLFTSLFIFMGLIGADLFQFKRKMRRQRHEFNKKQEWFDKNLAELKSMPTGPAALKKAAEIMDKLNEGREQEF